MITVSLSSRWSAPPPVIVSPESNRSGGVFRSELSLSLRTSRFRNKTLRLHSSNSSNGQPKEESKSSSSRFLNEDGVVEDMDGYLNYLSLEYDSVWDTKPSCWLILHNILATSVATTLIGAWWYIFLYSYPKAYTEMIAERRKKVTSGVEDTFGLRNSP